jgi:hypothetical protein
MSDYSEGNSMALEVDVSRLSRAGVPRHDKLKFFDEAEILFSANIYSSACHADEGSIYPSFACLLTCLYKTIVHRNVWQQSESL